MSGSEIGIGEQHMTEKQRRILDAAMEIFAEKGFSGASTSEIAKRAGVAEGTIFKHYKTKKDLLIGIVAPMFFRIVAPSLLEEVLEIVRAPHATFEEKMRALFMNRLQFVRSHQRVLRIAVQEIPFHEEVRDLAKQTLSARLLPDVFAAVEEYQARGQVRAGDPASIVRIAVTAMAGYALTRFVLLPEREWDDEREVEFMVAVLAQGLRPPA